ncbi:Myb-like DNA-binding domain containing protein [Trichomonas vaginalis G3]|uniref:Myb-like DNA-binding domain containing protein n=1 Tax=Trichomonas vaginalis (strain ATCC PRA-98 / G3) TaxID=412133 RepID=A2G0S9_TRIV3|nr:RNA polymerase II transcription regulator recruiting protein [Trichomonas vaginalis G3]EAX89237.1 Myb-like DNA-binding domain containing protein [Trichomonas vaginalis G3]KAI5507020.1 RNA polymerase II transcription regulator recruiting protein [Trichomonas vaginalis G3]|eukprot:XP_001302167.1 Myb-like DNA-binding domain containing protein [Trichomonas vaginalis G3]
MRLKGSSAKSLPRETRIKRTFNKNDDEMLLKAVQESKFTDWNEIAKKLGKWTARQCRERWKNYVDPSLSHEKWTDSEDRILLKRFEEIGTNWVKLKQFLPGRSVNNIKNRLQYLKNHNFSASSTTETDDAPMNDVEYYLDFLKISNLVNVH